MLSATDLDDFNRNGFLVIPNFADPQPLLRQSQELVEKAEIPQSIFTTGDQDHVGDDYFLSSVINSF